MIVNFARRLAGALAESAGWFVVALPGGLGSRARIGYWRLRGAQIGRGVRIDPGVAIDNPRYVSIGDNVWLDRNAILIAGRPRSGRETRFVRVDLDGLRGRIVIGSRCHIGVGVIISGLGGVRLGDDVTLAAGTKVYSLSHHYRSWTNPADDRTIFGSMAPVARQSVIEGVVTIGWNVGAGVDVLILPGSNIGDRTFIRPRSIVSGSWPDNSILAGAPAIVEGPRFLSHTADG